MNNSSAQDSYSITLNSSMDTITLDTSTWANMSSASGGLGNITISNGGYTIGAAGSTYSPSYTSGAGATVGGITSIGTFTSYDSNYSIQLPEEWVNCFPDFNRIENMCKEYPGLAIAFEKFKTTYKLVKDHYDTPEDQRPKP